MKKNKQGQREFNYDTPPRNAKCKHYGITFMPWEKEE